MAALGWFRKQSAISNQRLIAECRLLTAEG